MSTVDTADSGWAVGALGLAVAAAREAWGAVRQKRSDVKRDEITYLNLAVQDLQQRHDLCERRCNELREDVMTLLAHIHEITDPPKRRRKENGTRG